MLKVYQNKVPCEIYVTDFTSNSKMMERTPNMTRGTNFPHGHLVLQISLYDEHADRVSELKEGNYYRLLNVRGKLNGNYQLEGVMNGDKWGTSTKYKNCFQELDPKLNKDILAELLK